MIGKQLILGAMLLWAGNLLALDITESDGTYYANAEIVKKTPLGFSFISGGKAGWLDYRDLPQQEAAALGYDAAKAKDFEAKLAANDGCMLPDNATPPDNDPQLQQMLQNPNNVPPSPANTTVINPGDDVTYDPAIMAGGVVVGAPVTSWVSWNGHYYPSYYWHNWYWNHHWNYWHGHYYPAHYYHHHGTWYHGHYYPYHHGYLAKHPEHKPEYHPHHCYHHGGEHGGYHGGGEHGGGHGGRR